MKRIALALVGLMVVSFFAMVHNVSAKRLKADVTKDGTVDICDVLLVGNYYGAIRGSPNWKIAKGFDINNDGRIDILDFVMVITNYGAR